MIMRVDYHTLRKLGLLRNEPYKCLCMAILLVLLWYSAMEKGPHSDGVCFHTSQLQHQWTDNFSALAASNLTTTSHKGCTDIHPLQSFLISHTPEDSEERADRNCSLLESPEIGTRSEFDGPFLPSCPVTWFGKNEACKGLRELGRILFVGDSLMRQLAQTIWMIILDDYANGATQHWHKSVDLEFCTGDNQFNDVENKCRPLSMAYYKGPGGMFCKTWGHRNYVQFLEMYSYHGTDSSRKMFDANAMRVALNDSAYPRNIIVADMSALHYDLNFTRIIDEWGEPLMQEVGAAPGSTTVILSTVHHPQDALKPEKYLESQRSSVVHMYNDKLRAWAAQKNVFVFDTFTATTNATSYDGTHYGLQINAILAQLLLNAIEQIQH